MAQAADRKPVSAFRPARCSNTIGRDMSISFRPLPLPAEVKGRAFLHGMPGRYETWLDFEREIERSTISDVVCLTPDFEIADLSPDYAEYLLGTPIFRVHRLPMEDFAAPQDDEAFLAFLGAVKGRIEDGGRVLIHCAGGVGRAGLFGTCLLIALGLGIEQARQAVRAAGSRPETDKQIRFIERFSARQVAGSAEHAFSRENTSRLLDIVAAMVGELRPGLGGGEEPTLDQSLERELGFDSLARMELLQRLETEFGVALPETVLGQAETPSDLLGAVLAAGHGTAPRPVTRPAASKPLADGARAAPGADGARAAPGADGARAAPATLSTLVDVLAWHAEHFAKRTHIHICNGDRRETITHGALWTGAQGIAAGLVQRDLRPGQAVAIMLPTGADYFFCFMGTLLAGAIPVPIYPPGRPKQMEEHLERHRGILANCAAPLLIAEPTAQEFSAQLEDRLDDLRGVVTPAELTTTPTGQPLPQPSAADIALLQYTSGSTGDPKGVMLSHANLLANIRAMGQALGAGPDDVFVSWLPLYHDMGLIGAWLGSLVHAMPLVILSPLSFLARPQRWLAAIDEFGGTLSGGPNFAFEACVRRIKDEDLDGLDLASWRIAFNGAEPVSAGTMRAFAERFQPFGFDRRALMPVYGLAENSVGVSFPPPGRGPLIDVVDRRRLMTTGRALPAPEGLGDNIREVPCCGPPIPGHQVRIMDGAGREAAERREGRLQFRGPSAAAGYFRNEGATAELLRGDWRDSGDLAYLADGEIYITGRAKDMIVKAGRNIFPAELEDAIGDLAGVQKGGVAVFGSPDPQIGTERLVVLAETRRQGAAESDEIRRRVVELAADLVGTPPDRVELVKPRGVPKTSSGKIRRSAARLSFEAGEADGKTARAVTRLWLGGAGAGWRHGARRLALGAYGLGAATLLGLIALPVWLSIAALPSRGWAWAVTRGTFRLITALLGAPIRVEGLENLSRAGTCVICVNHASYLDGPALMLALPGQYGFVVKAELLGSLVPRLFLGRLGALFVERFEASRGIADAEAAVGAARAGQSLLFFPEGTFTRAPGLLPFQMGAFSTAVAAGVPVLPVIMRGTRAMLRDGTWQLRPGSIRVRIGSPLEASPGAPGVSDWARAVDLRDRTRHQILTHLDEPDLGSDFAPLAAMRGDPSP